ncbi:hypothetical protein [Lonsdalea quercina]|jgi:hypothetical protein|uniref:hypothetical protein n=1 Tax=Lonsdalea quercina TaxID=71657 RepID=UPI00397565CC
MQHSFVGAAHMGSSSFDARKYIQFHHSNVLSSASFTPPPRKSLLQIIIEFLSQKGEP